MKWWIVKTFYICSYVAIPLFIPNTVIFHPVSLANGLLEISRGIAGSEPGGGVPTWPTLKLPLNAVSPGSQRATELAKL